MTSTSRREIPPVVPGYAIGALIAHGTFSTVWSARALDGAEELAVKVVPVAGRPTTTDDSGQDVDSLAFELSALASTRGKGEHVVEVHDVVAIEDPAPAVAIVMQRLRFGTLARLVTTRGHLTAGEVVTLVTPIAHTLGVLHEGAVIHGDLSPSNVGFDDLGRPVLLDLGVSAVIGTPREHVYGTPGFVAPEVAAGQVPTAGADVYGVGALGWYALTGEPPASPAERVSLTELVPTVPGALAEAIERALEAEPEHRGTAHDLATAVYEATRPAPISMVHGDDPALFLTHRVREIAREAREPMTRTERRSDLRSRSRRSHLRVLATLVVAVLLGGVGVAVAASSRAPVPTLGAVEGAATKPPTTKPSTAEPATTATPVSASATATADPTAHEVLQGLLDTRARAWTKGSTEDLAAVFAPDTPMLAHDAAALAQASGFVYEGLEFVASEVRVHSESSGRITVLATVTTSPYDVRRVAGTDAKDPDVEPRPGARSRLRFILTREDQGWRSGEVAGLSGS